MMDEHIFQLLLRILVFAFGASIASFLNVVIYRVPRGESIVRPPSHCPKCGAWIKWRNNLPILSWIFLRGKCASCKAPISPRYLIVEVLGGTLFLLFFIHSPCLLSLLVAWIWVSLLMVGAFIDFDHKLLPDFVTIGGMILGVAYNALCSLLAKSMLPIWFSLMGMVVGLVIVWLIRFLGSKAFKREAMGMGDVLFMGAVGAYQGPTMAILVLILSSLLGSIVGLILITINKARLGKFVEIPYGPYIAISSIIAFFCGNEIILWYLKLVGVRP